MQNNGMSDQPPEVNFSSDQLRRLGHWLSECLDDAAPLNERVWRSRAEWMVKGPTFQAVIREVISLVQPAAPQPTEGGALTKAERHTFASPNGGPYGCRGCRWTHPVPLAAAQDAHARHRLEVAYAAGLAAHSRQQAEEIAALQERCEFLLQAQKDANQRYADLRSQRPEGECACAPCPGRGNDGHGMAHCAECCFGTGVEADIACPVHGAAAQRLEGVTVAEVLKAIAADLYRNHDMPPRKDSRSYSYRNGWWDGVHHAAKVVERAARTEPPKKDET